MDAWNTLGGRAACRWPAIELITSHRHITNPQDGADVSGLVTDATAADKYGVLSRSSCLIIATDLSAPYSFSWDSARTGEGLNATLSLVA